MAKAPAPAKDAVKISSAAAPITAPKATATATAPHGDARHAGGAVTAASRVYKNTQEIDHDLFKLSPAEMKKNVSFTEHTRYEYFMHSHIFHTVDSNGRVQDTCNSVGGHHHAITVEKNGEGVPVIHVSPAMKYISKKINGRLKRVAVPVLDDEHTHEIEYLGSEKIKLRQANIEFAKFDAALKARQEISVDGVEAG